MSLLTIHKTKTRIKRRVKAFILKLVSSLWGKKNTVWTEAQISVLHAAVLFQLSRPGWELLVTISQTHLSTGVTVPTPGRSSYTLTCHSPGEGSSTSPSPASDALMVLGAPREAPNQHNPPRTASQGQWEGCEHTHTQHLPARAASPRPVVGSLADH